MISWDMHMLYAQATDVLSAHVISSKCLLIACMLLQL
jgi:hypothetical protein